MSGLSVCANYMTQVAYIDGKLHVDVVGSRQS